MSDWNPNVIEKMNIYVKDKKKFFPLVDFNATRGTYTYQECVMGDDGKLIKYYVITKAHNVDIEKGIQDHPLYSDKK